MLGIILSTGTKAGIILLPSAFAKSAMPGGG
jgi:hypothetical protein